jgi:hypothetical protein
MDQYIIGSPTTKKKFVLIKLWNWFFDCDDLFKERVIPIFLFNFFVFLISVAIRFRPGTALGDELFKTLSQIHLPMPSFKGILIGVLLFIGYGVWGIVLQMKKRNEE